MKKKTFAIVGAVLGIPFSYFFQSEIVRNKFGGIGGYLQHLDDVVQNGDLLTNLIIGIVVFALAGLGLGYYLDMNEEKKEG